MNSVFFIVVDCEGVLLIQRLLVNTEQPLDPPLSYMFCPTDPPPNSLFNSPPSPSSIAIPMI